MPFDYLGTMTRAQYNAAKEFVEQASADSEEVREHLESLAERSDSFTAKLMLAGHAAGGTQISGFSGAIYTNADRSGAAVGEQTGAAPLPGVTRVAPHPLISFLRGRRPNRSGFGGVAVDFSNGSFSGGDIPWIDTPVKPQAASPWGAYDDLHTAVIMAAVKESVLPQIRAWREDLELKSKQGLDYREQLLVRIYDLQVAEADLSSWFAQVEEQFEGAEPGSAINDSEAERLSPESELDGGLLAAREQDGTNVRYTNLWEEYPATRTWPVWPLIAEDEKGADALDALDREYEARLRSQEAAQR